jgi:hypothetical protein
MIAKPVVLGMLAAACVTAAAGGAYVAVRQNDAPRPFPVQAQPAAAPAQPVAETEAIVSPVPAPAPIERHEAAPRPAAPERTAARPAPSARVPAASRAERSTNASVERPRAPAPSERPRDPSSESAPPIERTSPAREAAPAPPTTSVAPEPVAAEPVPALAKPQREEVVVPSSSVVGLKVETSLSSETSHVEDRVEARVTREVTSEGRVAIPAGARVLGDVVVVERGGKMKDKARLGVRFHTLVLADGTRVPFRTDAIYREGASPGSESARKIGGAAIGGAVLGAIIGGAKGAAIGGATGAAGGGAVVMAGDRNPATLPFGTIVTVRLSAPVVVEIEREM